MKIGIFTDSHYSSQEITCKTRQNSKSLEKIKDAYAFFKQEKCDFVICLGDLTDSEECHNQEIINLQKVAEVIKESKLETFCVMGNHDSFSFTRDEFYSILGCRPEDIEREGKTLIFIDACFFKNGNHYMPGDSDWTDTFYPHVEELENKIASTENDVYIFLHQNLDPNTEEVLRLHNSDEINEMLKKYKNVKTVYQGHDHEGRKSVHKGIKYITFPAVCENDNAYFIEEI